MTLFPFFALFSFSHMPRFASTDLPSVVDGLWYLVAPLIASLLFLHFRHARRVKPETPITHVCNAAVQACSLGDKFQPDVAHRKLTKWYKELFFKLQNLEDYPEVLAPARQELLAMLSHALLVAQRELECHNSSNILSIETYSAKGLLDFLKDEHEETLSGWTKYSERRRQGGGPELFATAKQAQDWLVRQAPVKFVDGAWLGHIHKVTTPFPLRSVTKHAWQVLSEELGDGDSEKHHVTLYRKLLESIGRPLPSGHSVDFIHADEWKRDENHDENHDIWKAAVGQLVISLFPHEFLAEILGFNLHFEEIRLETMQVAHELTHYGIDPYYFLIHISIDNADSGHTAMASHAVAQYLDVVRATEGEAAASHAWKRIQVGYVLSQNLGRLSCPSSLGLGPESADVLLSALGTQVLEIFRSKALVSHGIHSRSRVRIGSQTLQEWLEATTQMETDTLHLLTALGQAKPWVVAGNSRKSLLVRELSWRGRMFGAFTKNEVTTICQWIDALAPENETHGYWNFTQRQPTTPPEAVAELQDPASHHPYVPAGNAASLHHTFDSYMAMYACPAFNLDGWDALTEHPSLNAVSCNRLPDIVALWFAHIGLLENTINTPSRTTNPVHLSILRLLRAQAGFGMESDIVAGMDEVRRGCCTSLVDIGLELAGKLSGIAVSARPQTLKQVFLLAASHGQRRESCQLANDMLRWSARPSANLGFLLGLALAFVEFKQAILRAPSFLAPRSRILLQNIVARERASLEVCVQELQRTDEALYQDLLRGSYLAVSILPNCI